jgi:sugar/nucleoside kinase (ribokinase family)
MCTNLGVSTDLNKGDIDLDALANSKIVYIEGYLWDAEQPRAASIRAMECAKSKGVQVAFTFSDMFLVDRFGDDFKQITKKFCDIVFCNADEVRHFFGITSLEQCAAELGKIVETAFITDGPNGSHVVHEGQAKHVAGFKAKAVDTVGAGDAFAGGVLYGIANGLDREAAARWGNYVASRVVQIYGARLEESIADQVGKY